LHLVNPRVVSDLLFLQSHSSVIHFLLLLLLSFFCLSKIRETLDDFVIGQDVAKRVLSVAVYNHYSRVKANLSMTRNGAPFLPPCHPV